MKTIFLSIVILMASLSLALAHGGKKHKKDSTKAPMDSTMNMGEQKEHDEGDTTHHHDEGMAIDESKVKADLDDFPTLHPLIVHFAIVLIIVAAGMQLLNLYFMKKEIAWIITAILFVGVLAAWVAGRNFHPHTHGISAHAQLVLDLAQQHGGAGAFFASFGPRRYAELLEVLKKRGARLGGMTAQYFLRRMGLESWVLSIDVVRVLVDEGVLHRAPSSKRDMQAVQAAFDHWCEQSGKSLTYVSRVLAMSID